MRRFAANTQRPMRGRCNFMLGAPRIGRKNGMAYLDGARIAQSRVATSPSKIRRAKIGSHRHAAGAAARCGPQGIPTIPEWRHAMNPQTDNERTIPYFGKRGAVLILRRRAQRRGVVQSMQRMRSVRGRQHRRENAQRLAVHFFAHGKVKTNGWIGTVRV
jgi:hypothetical protein